MVFWENMFGHASYLCLLKQSDFLAATDSPKLT